jgi:Domain of unknown function (DUF4158)
MCIRQGPAGGVPRDSLSQSFSSCYHFGGTPSGYAGTRAFNFPVAAHFVLQLGYFKAKQQFFVYEPGAVFDDLRHIVERYFPDRALAHSTMLSKSSRLIQQQIILKLTRYRFCDDAAQKELERKAQRSVRLSAQPVFLLREMLQHLSQQGIVAPAY